MTAYSDKCLHCASNLQLYNCFSEVRAYTEKIKSSELELQVRAFKSKTVYLHCMLYHCLYGRLELLMILCYMLLILIVSCNGSC